MASFCLLFIQTIDRDTDYFLRQLQKIIMENNDRRIMYHDQVRGAADRVISENRSL